MTVETQGKVGLKLSTHPCIYRIDCTSSNKFYIGSAKNLRIRARDHVNKLKRNGHPNALLQNSWNKYGKDTIVFSVVELCSVENLLLTEQKHIDLSYDNQIKCMNLCPTAGSRIGFKHTEATKALMSKAAEGVKKSAEHIKNMTCTKQEKYGNPVSQLDEKNNIIAIFPSTREAARQLKTQHASIASAASGAGRHKTAGGYRWSYIIKEKENNLS